MRDKVRLGLVGLGYWGSNLLRTFSRLAQVEVTDLCDLDGERLGEVARRHPRVRCTSDLGELLRREDVHAVAIATPPSRHQEMAEAALRAGKDVWVEKPLTLSAAGARSLVAIAARERRILFVDETFLYDPLVQEVKRLIAAGSLGRLYHLSFQRLGMGRIRRDSNVWWNSAPHDLSILLYLVPRPVRRATLQEHCYVQPGVADIAVADLELEGGVSAHVYLNWIYPEKTARLTVIGSQRMLTYEGRFSKRGVTIHDYAIERRSAAGGGRDGRVPILPIQALAARRLECPATAEPLALAAEHFVSSILTRTEPLTSGRRSLRALEVLEAAEDAWRRGQPGDAALRLA